MNSEYINYDWILRKNRPISMANMDKVKSTLKQSMRDWSLEGKEERGLCYGPIMREIKRLFPKPSFETRVLVPGCGMSRLVWEIANAGYHAQGNEFSYFMLLASYLILNCTPKENAYRIFPFVTQTNNQYSPKGQFRPVVFPDVNPSVVAPRALSMVAGDFQEVYEKQEEEWDCIAGCFFLDTANNVIEYVRLISKLLRIGGYWIHFGPLLYHYSGMRDEISIELSWDEIKACLSHYGLKLVREERGQPAHYCNNKDGMMRTTYSCVSATCIKIRKTPDEKPAPRYKQVIARDAAQDAARRKESDLSK